MKNSKLLSCLSLLLCPLAVQSQQEGQWQWVAPYPPRLSAYSATAVGAHAYFWCSENLVMATLDGGKSFTVSQYSPTEDVALGCCNTHGIAFADSLTGYVTDIAYGEFRTTNGGNSWTQVGNPYSGFEMIEFGSSTTGWKIGEGGTYRTLNGGYSWSPVGELYSTGGIFSSIYALDGNKVWVMKSFYAGRPLEGSIWYSQNGGVTWAQLHTGISSDTAAQVTYSTMRINPSGIGFALGSVYRPSTGVREAFILKTTDLGTSWTYTGLPDERWEDIVSVSDSVWVFYGNFGSYPDNQPISRRTTDMGQTWVLSMPFTTGNYNFLGAAVYIAPSNTIIVTTLQGIYTSLDQGQAYSRLTSERDIIVTDVFLDKHPLSPSEQIVVATSAYNQAYLLSTDGGTQWERQEIPASVGSDLRGTRIVDGQIYAITNQNQLYKSTDLGATWNRITVPTYSALRALDVYDTNTLVLQGYPDLLSSSDGGTTWSRGPFLETMLLNESVVIHPGEIVAVGGFYEPTETKGILFHTTDNGLSWRVEDTPGEMNLVSMIDENVGFAMGTYQLYKTTTSGNTWFLSHSATSSFSVFCFEDLTHGILRDGYFTFETYDGGDSWQQIDLDIPIQYPFYRMAFNARGEFLVAGGGRLVIRSVGKAIEEIVQPGKFPEPAELYQSSPNPFNPSTAIRYRLSEDAHVTLNVYNMLGQRIATLVDEPQTAGYKSVVWHGKNDSGLGLASGIYICRMTAGSFTAAKRMLLLK